MSQINTLSLLIKDSMAPHIVTIKMHKMYLRHFFISTSSNQLRIQKLFNPLTKITLVVFMRLIDICQNFIIHHDISGLVIASTGSFQKYKREKTQILL
nr:MAG TPA: hypothetical protein [Caudoviricetes sp.]